MTGSRRRFAWPWQRVRATLADTERAHQAWKSSIGELHATVQRWPEVNHEAERQRRIFAENHFAEAVAAEFERRRIA